MSTETSEFVAGESVWMAGASARNPRLREPVFNRSPIAVSPAKGGLFYSGLILDKRP